MKVLYVHFDEKGYNRSVEANKNHVDYLIKEGYISEKSRAETIFNWRPNPEDYITKFEGVVKDEIGDNYLVDNLKGTVKVCNRKECYCIGI